MKLLHIIAAYKPAYVYGGPTMSVARLCEQLVKGGQRIHVYTTTANGAEELNVMHNTPVQVDDVVVTYFKRITKDHTHFSPALLWALWKNVQRYDAVHVHAWWNLVSVLSCLIALVRGVPVFVSPRGTLSPYTFQNKNNRIKEVVHHLLGKPLLNRSHMHATSNREAAALSNLLSPKSITTVPNFVKLGAVIQPGKAEISRPVKLIFLSRIEEKKGLETLFDALTKVTVPYRLTIAGDGKREYVDMLKALAAHRNIAQYIDWAGFITDSKFDLLRQHDLFVLISYDENFANAVIESLSVGTAVLISQEVGLAEYVKGHQLGWLCERNAGSVSASLNEIALDKTADLLKIRATAPLIIRKDFDEAPLTKLYTDLYTQHLIKE
ncbi:XrtY-associated glycosyltransferase XYAG1 [Mucilaginibacter lutimaris]|uniref:XrtY-associated glycosyltransferase XYAG1 n=1 Tax=Mucilaginibacter lutimaris TaxID=931629 RepID=A0ABW2ZGV5_9SPHI